MEKPLGGEREGDEREEEAEDLNAGGGAAEWRSRGRMAGFYG